MQQQEIYSFLERYFTAHHCNIIDKSQGHLTVQLTIDLDKELMNRPFYWHYLEKTGGVPNPMILTLITNQDLAPNTIKGEFIHFGSPRLHQIFKSTQKFGRFIRLFENVTKASTTNIPLQPWLGINMKVSYQCDRKRDQLISLGLHLINGTIITNFQTSLERLSLTPKIPDYCFTISPLIKPKSGFKRIEQYIQAQIEADDHTWAAEAHKRWQEDLRLLEHFYENLEEKPECYEIEKQALQNQYQPKITVQMINGGLFYLSQKAMNQVENNVLYR